MTLNINTLLSIWKLETVAALHHDSHGETDRIKEVYDEFLEEMNNIVEDGGACNPKYGHKEGHPHFRCPSGQFCKPDDDIGSEDFYYWGRNIDAPGTCTPCPDNFVSWRETPELCEGDTFCEEQCGRPPEGQCAQVKGMGRYSFMPRHNCPSEFYTVHDLISFLLYFWCTLNTLSGNPHKNRGLILRVCRRRPAFRRLLLCCPRRGDPWLYSLPKSPQRVRKYL